MKIGDLLHAASSRFAAAFPILVHWFSLPAFMSLLAMSVGIALGDVVPIPVFGLTAKILAAGALICGGVSILAGKNIPRLIGFLACGFLIILAAKTGQYYTFTHWEQGFDSRYPVHISGRILSVPMKREAGFKYLVKCDSLYDSQGKSAFKGKVLLCLSSDEPLYAERILAKGRYIPPAGPAVPGAFDGYTQQLSSGVWGTFSIQNQLVTEFHPSLLEKTSAVFRKVVYQALSYISIEGHRALLQAAFLGDKNPVPDALQRTFRDAGITHLLAISGQNVAMITSALLLIVWPIPISRRYKLLFAIAGIWWFLFVVGVVPSLFRAVLMATVVIGSYLVQKKNYALNALGLAGITWLLLSPQSLFTPSYQLSFGATFGIVALYPCLRSAFTLPKIPFRFAAAFALDAFYISIVCYLATMPVMLYHFGSLSLYGLFFNIIAVLLMTMALWVLMAGIALQAVWPFAAQYVVLGSGAILSVLIAAADFGKHIPYATVTFVRPFLGHIVIYILFIAGLFTVALGFLRKYLLVAATAACIMIPTVLLLSHESSILRIAVFPDKNHLMLGLAIPGTSACIIGTASQVMDQKIRTGMIVPWLRGLRISKLSGLLLYGQNDSLAKSAKPVPDSFPNTPVFVLPGAADSLRNDGKIRILKCGDAISIADACTCVVAGLSGVQTDGLRCQVGARSFLVNYPKSAINLFSNRIIIELNLDSLKNISEIIFGQKGEIKYSLRK
jgi:competence protein ComEC